MENSPWWEQTEFGIDDVCNLGSFPMSMHLNPIYLTARQILEDPSCPKVGDLEGVVSFRDSILFQFSEFLRVHDKFLHDHERVDLAENIYKITGKKYFKENKICLGHKSCYAPWFMGPIAAVGCRLFWNSFSNSHTKSKWRDFLTTLRSIREAGYNFKTPDPLEYFPPGSAKIYHGFATCHRLVGKDKERVFMTQGNHRAAIFFALYPDKKMPCLYNHENFYKKSKKILYYLWVPQSHPSLGQIPLYKGKWDESLYIGIKNHYEKKHIEEKYYDYKAHWKSVMYDYKKKKKIFKAWKKDRVLVGREETLNVIDSYLNVNKEVETEWKDFLRQSGFERFL